MINGYDFFDRKIREKNNLIFPLSLVCLGKVRYIVNIISKNTIYLFFYNIVIYNYIIKIIK